MKPGPDPGVTFRPLARDDLPMLHAWLQRPHVAAWWREPTTLADLENDYLSDAARGSSTRAYIALLGAEPLGFIQSYVALGSAGGWWKEETDPGTRGIDQFLADASQLGRGLGSRMADAFVAQLFDDPAVTKVQTDPSPDNERAIRCYRRAGFVAQREVITPDGRALLMLRPRRTASRGSCLCGGVSFVAALPPKWVAHCHCTRCQRAHGAPFVTWAGFAADAVAVQDEQARLRWHSGVEGGRRAFCGRCGSPMFFASDRWPGELHVARALFLEPIERTPQAHVFYETHVEWARVEDELPRKSSST